VTGSRGGRARIVLSHRAYGCRTCWAGCGGAAGWVTPGGGRVGGRVWSGLSHSVGGVAQVVELSHPLGGVRRCHEVCDTWDGV